METTGSFLTYMLWWFEGVPSILASMGMMGMVDATEEKRRSTFKEMKMKEMKNITVC